MKAIAIWSDRSIGRQAGSNMKAADRRWCSTIKSCSCIFFIFVNQNRNNLKFSSELIYQWKRNKIRYVMYISKNRWLCDLLRKGVRFTWLRYLNDIHEIKIDIKYLLSIPQNTCYLNYAHGKPHGTVKLSVFAAEPQVKLAVFKLHYANCSYSRNAHCNNTSSTLYFIKNR